MSPTHTEPWAGRQGVTWTLALTLPLAACVSPHTTGLSWQRGGSTPWQSKQEDGVAYRLLWLQCSLASCGAQYMLTK